MNCAVVASIVMANIGIVCLYESGREWLEKRKGKAWVSGIAGVVLISVAAWIILLEISEAWWTWRDWFR